MPAPVMAEKTKGSTIYLANGQTLIDGIASWWTACHGYNHPAIAKAARKQLKAMPHIMLGGMVHQPALSLSKALSDLLGHDLNHVFFTDSGSVSVEVALKMAFQYWLNHKEKRPHLLAFKGGYHGDTLATMAICDPEEGMHTLFNGILPQHPILPLPDTTTTQRKLDHYLSKHAGEIAAIIVEPLVQGAGGMIFHTAETLHFIYKMAQKHNVLLICDEIFTGFGRTGDSLFAFEKATIVPDIVTVSKALTGGTMALAATIARTHIYDAFYSDNPQHALMHGPTFMANPLACSCALASVGLFSSTPRLKQIAVITERMKEKLDPCRHFPAVKDVRVLGAIGVVELHDIPDMKRLKATLLSHNVWIRPFRNIIYLTPAFTITRLELDSLCQAIYKTLKQLY